MFVLMWATLLFAAWRNSANTVASPVEIAGCQNGSCINLSGAQQTAESGLCVVIPCSFTTNKNITAQRVVWYKCEQSEQSCNKLFFDYNNTAPPPKFRGRASLLEPDLSKNNCSIIISNLTKSDSGSYQLKVYGILDGATNGYMLSSLAKITVTDLHQKPTVMIPPLTAGQQTTLSCTAPGLCSGSVPEITWTWRGAGVKDSHITGNTTDFKTENLTAVTQRHSSTLNFDPSAEHHGTEVTCKVRFTGDRTTEETVTLNVTDVKKPEQTSKHPNAPSPNVPGKFDPKLLNSSGCKKQVEVLTCVCIIEEPSIPTIKWPLLDNYTNYSVITTVTNHSVSSTVTITVKGDMPTTVKCVSINNKNKKERNWNLTIKTELEKDAVLKLLEIVTRPETIIAFFMGVVLSTIFCCLSRICCRKKQKTYGNMETLEMATHQECALIEDGQAVEDDHTYYQEAAEEGAGVAAGKSEVEYSTINFSKSSSSTHLGNSQETTDTEYAEIKTEAQERRDREDRQETGKIEEDEEEELCVAEEGEGEDAALYSDVKDIISEI